MEWPKSKNNKMEELLERMSQFEANLAQLISTGMPNHTPSPATDEATSSPNEQEQLSPEQEEEMKLKIQELQQKEEELNLRAEKLDKLGSAGAGCRPDVGADHRGHPHHTPGPRAPRQTVALPGGRKCRRAARAVTWFGRTLGLAVQRVCLGIATGAGAGGRFCELPGLDVDAGALPGHQNFGVCVSDARVCAAVWRLVAGRTRHPRAGGSAGAGGGRHRAGEQAASSGLTYQ